MALAQVSTSSPEPLILSLAAFSLSTFWSVSSQHQVPLSRPIQHSNEPAQET